MLPAMTMCLASNTNIPFPRLQAPPFTGFLEANACALVLPLSQKRQADLEDLPVNSTMGHRNTVHPSFSYPSAPSRLCSHPREAGGERQAAAAGHGAALRSGGHWGLLGRPRLRAPRLKPTSSLVSKEGNPGCWFPFGFPLTTHAHILVSAERFWSSGQFRQCHRPSRKLSRAKWTAAARVPSRVPRIFDRYDLDGSGLLERHELMKARTAKAIWRNPHPKDVVGPESDTV